MTALIRESATDPEQTDLPLWGRAGARVAELDGIRGIAVLLVVTHHYSVNFSDTGALAPLFRAFREFGWVGVDLFFLLSGYLITGILLDAKGSPNYLPAFFARRALRILPAYFLVLFVCFAAAPALGMPVLTRNAGDAPWFILFGANFLTGIHGWPDAPLTPLWTLAIEEHFYLVWPFIVLVLPVRHLAVATVLLAVESASLRGFALHSGLNPTAAYVLTFTHLDAKQVAQLVAASTRFARVPSVWLCREGAALLFGLVQVYQGYQNFGEGNERHLTWGLFLLAAGMGGGLIYLLSLTRDHLLMRFLRLKPLLVAGRLSYGMYLYHMLLVHISGEMGPYPPSRTTPLVIFSLAQLTTLVILAEVSFRFVEAPMSRLKERIPYGPAASGLPR